MNMFQKKTFTENGSFSKSVMNGFPSAPIGDFENEQRDSSAAISM